ncbi:MAG: hypothetical protein HGA65_12595 [Oscillochloris sp.]|nr:hypothetical protein [Oscillochloris sp.]
MTTSNPTAPARRSLHVPGLAYAALILALFFGSIGGAQFAGLWSVSGKLSPDGAPLELSGADPAEVKGWMTIQAVLDAYHIDQAALYDQFNIPAETPPSTALKDLEALAPDFSVTALREWLAAQRAP